MVERECKRCKKSYPKTADYFNGTQGSNTYLKLTCRICSAKDQKLRRELRKNNPAPKDHVCPICKSTKPNWRWRNWCVDHNHQTGKFRGWLCDKCNIMIGQGQEKIEVFERAIDYLRKE
jgi:hypothetical protein|tara:strand:- start:3916 stop:4272 length:357 start_codon:yes stop_codon:yes gene_type:complete